MCVVVSCFTSFIPGGNLRLTAADSLTIRPATSFADLNAVRTLLHAYAAHLADSANIRINGYDDELASLPRPYATPQGIILLSHIAGKAAGCVAFRPVHVRTAIAPGEQACEMKRLWVDPGFRGHQLGRRLTEAGIAWARDRGYTAMYLDTVPAAMAYANTLYQALGFKPVPRYNDNSVADVVFFRLALDQPLPSPSDVHA